MGKFKSIREQRGNLWQKMWEIHTLGFGKDVAPFTVLSLSQIWGPDRLTIKQQFAGCGSLRKGEDGAEESWSRFLLVGVSQWFHLQ